MATQSANIPEAASEKARQRTSLACKTCRTKRIRCDGVQPTCQSCLQKGLNCEYQFREDRRKPPSRRYTEALLARIKSLEEQLQRQASSVSQIKPVGEDVLGGAVAIPEYSSESEQEELSDSHGRDPVDDISEMVGRLNVGEDGQLRYFGSLSNFHLLRGLMKHETSRSNDQVRLRAANMLQQLNYTFDVSLELQEELLDLFWKWQNSWQYVVHKSAFLQEYNQGQRGRYCSPLLLCAILALASRYSDRPELRNTPEDANSAGETLAEQAKLMLFHEIEAPTTSTVQAATLIALREFAVNKEASAWVHIGVATRIAYNLGLNLDCRHWVRLKQISELEEEVRKVAWWGCYLVDKLSNIGLGRPSAIQAHDISIPKPSPIPEVEFEPWCAGDDTPTQELPHSRMVSNSHFACELFSIVSIPLDILYAPNSQIGRHEKETLVSSTDVTLTAFHNTLPSFLRLPNSSNQPQLPHVYQLHLQYHVTVILLHRPFVKPRKNGASPPAPPSSESRQSHLEICRASATAISGILRAYRIHYTLRCIVISTVHVTFTASIIHLYDAASSDAAIRSAAKRNLQTCIESLQEMNILWSWSARALRALQLLAREWTVLMKLNEQTHPEFWAISRKLDLAMRTILPAYAAEDQELEDARSLPPGELPDMGILTDHLSIDNSGDINIDFGPSISEGFVGGDMLWNSALGFGHIPDFSFDNFSYDQFQEDQF